MSDSKKQSIIVIGIGMLIIAGIMLFFALNQPKITLEEYSLSKAENSSTSSVYNTDDSAAEQSTEAKKVTTSISFPINLNTCTVDDLTAIDGLGQSKASTIVEYRSYLGGYTSVEQIKNISGIGDSVYEQISPYLCV